MTTAPDPGVVITTTEMHREMRALHDAVTRVETKIDGFNATVQSTAVDVTDHESRIRALEQKVWRAVGGAAVLGAGIGVAAQFLARWTIPPRRPHRAGGRGGGFRHAREPMSYTSMPVAYEVNATQYLGPKRTAPSRPPGVGHAPGRASTAAIAQARTDSTPVRR
ncbi:hypothetical protein ABZZ80_24730 [Streptomyces sp. NPDC006356]